MFSIKSQKVNFTLLFHLLSITGVKHSCGYSCERFMTRIKGFNLQFAFAALSQQLIINMYVKHGVFIHRELIVFHYS